MAYGGGKSAVDAILAEAADLVALEQIARLNTAHLDDSAALPSSLESRFRKLKSLPATAPLPPPAKSLGRSVTAPPQHRDDPPADSPPDANPPAPAPEAARKEEQSSPPQPHPHPPNPTIPAVREEDEDEEEDLERLFGPRRGRPTLKERNRRTHSSSRSPPPPRQACCFPFSPKKALQRTPTARSSKKTHAEGYTGDVLGVDTGEWGDENKRMATELREQQRKLKKALEEQVKVSRETAKMARWVKQASARMTHTDAIDDLLSDLDLDDDDDDLK